MARDCDTTDRGQGTRPRPGWGWTPALAACLLAAGCHLPQWVHNGFKVGPNYRPPPVAVADNWIDADDPRVLPLPPNYADWWSVFRDPVLDGLIRTAYAQNLTLREAGYRVLEARARRGIAVGGLFPQVQQAFGAYTRNQLSGTVANRRPDLSYDDWIVGLNASWELDLWGKFRRAIESADAALDAAAYQYDAVLVSLVADVAQAYVELRTAEQQLEYTRGNVESQREVLKLARVQAREGQTDEVGVHLARANLEATEAALPALEVRRRQAANRLCVLLGMPPVDLAGCLAGGSGIPAAPPEAAVGIPADLVRRRPDVRAAEREVAAQSAQIGIAVSELYPSIIVTGEIFLESAEFARLFQSRSTGGLVGPSFRWNVLNYGRIRNNVIAQDAVFLQRVAAYQRSVLEADREVEDALVAFLRTQAQVQSLAASIEESQAALELLLIQYKEGEINFSPIFVLQGQVQVRQNELAAAKGFLAQSLIEVYRALGGGWEIRCRPHGAGPVRPAPAVGDSSPEELPPPREAPGAAAPAPAAGLGRPRGIEASAPTQPR